MCGHLKKMYIPFFKEMYILKNIFPNSLIHYAVVLCVSSLPRWARVVKKAPVNAGDARDVG